MKLIDILKKYTAGELTLEEANAELKKDGAGYKLNPEKNIITEEEKRATTVGCYPDMANGWGLLDSGTKTYDKVKVEGGKLILDNGKSKETFSVLT